MNDFRYTTFPQDIIFGAGALEKIADAVTQLGGTRALLLTTRSQRTNGNVARLEKLLGEKLVGMSDTTQQHVPQANVDAVAALAQEKKADILIALGGGSAIGVAKATAHALQSPISALPILAIPTTYAGSEMTPFFGVTREQNGVTKKETTTNTRVIPRLVVYDPLLTLDVPAELTASTGINAFAHCVEAVYSITRNPLSTAAALEGARLIFDALPKCFENGQDVDARTEMLQGAYLAGVSLGNVTMALHHGVCHVLGGTANVPHGIANAIVLPHAMRFNADACAPELARIADAVGVEHDYADVMTLQGVELVRELVTRLKLPTRLRDAGVSEEDLPKLAGILFQNKNVQNNPKKILDVVVMERFLQEMY